MIEPGDYYKKYADYVRRLYEAFIESGFTEEQSFELMSVYIRQSITDSIMRGIYDAKRKEQRYREMRDVINRNRELKKEQENKNESN